MEGLATLFDKASPHGRQVAELGAPLSLTLRVFAITLKRTIRRAPISVAGRLLGVLTPVDINVIGQDLGHSSMLTTRVVRASGMLSIYPERLRFIKQTKEFNNLILALESARDMITQMQYDCIDLSRAADIFRATDRLIDAMSKTKATLATGFQSIKKKVPMFGSGDEEEVLKRELEASSETMASSAQQIRKMLQEIGDGWPEFMKSVDSLQSYLSPLLRELNEMLGIPQTKMKNIGP